jgi:hypothetical protein
VPQPIAAPPEPVRRAAPVEPRTTALESGTTALEPRSMDVATPPARPRPPVPVVRISSPQTGRFPASSYRMLSDRADRGDGIWSRLRRGIFGVPKPVFED